MIGARRSYSGGKGSMRKLVLAALVLVGGLLVLSVAVAAYWSATTPAPQPQPIDINLDPAEHLK